MNVNKRKTFYLKQENLSHIFTSNNIFFSFAIIIVQVCSFLLSNIESIILIVYHCSGGTSFDFSLENYNGENSR